MIITEALSSDHHELTDLTIASKSYWDYSRERIEEWVPDLMITSDYIEEHAVFK